jgi:hypothetical protein
MDRARRSMRVTTNASVNPIETKKVSHRAVPDPIETDQLVRKDVCASEGTVASDLVSHHMKEASCAQGLGESRQAPSEDAGARNALEKAYAMALASLGLIGRTDPLTAIIAQAIITTAQTGETDPNLICAYALKSLGIPPPIDVP